MATVALGFSPRYSSFTSHSLQGNAKTPAFDLGALVEWIKSCGVEALRNAQDVISRIVNKYIEHHFTPTYGMQSPAWTLNAAEIHEAVARQVYIESIGAIVGNQAASRLGVLSESNFGWNGSDAEAMTLDSLSSLQDFFILAGNFANDFGFFLGYEGEILISWTSKSGELIDMSFSNGRAELCSNAEELEFDINDPALYATISDKYLG